MSTLASQENNNNTKKPKVWHLRSGPFNKMQLLFTELCTQKAETEYICTVCPLAKQTRVAFNKSSIQTNDVFLLVHVDIWGPMNSQSENMYYACLSP